MGLSITVGILADLLENEPEGAEHVRSDFDIISEILGQHGLPAHEEPTSLPGLHDRSGMTGFPYSFLHYLRRFYARGIAQTEQPFARRLYAIWFAQPMQPPPPVGHGEDPSTDPVLIRVASPKHHLLWHSDCEGYYVPIDFPNVLEDHRLTGGSVGSTARLLDELAVVAAPLGIVLHNGQLHEADANAIAEEDENGGPD
jgi:hypothetical protein